MHKVPGAYQQNVRCLNLKHRIKYTYLSLCRFIRAVFVKDKTKAVFI